MQPRNPLPPCFPPPPTLTPVKTTMLVIAQTGKKGRGGEIFFHRMNLNFHHVPKYPWRGLGTKRSNRKEEQKPLIYILKSTYFYPRSGGHDRGKNSNLDQKLLPTEAPRNGEEIFIHQDLHMQARDAY